MDKSRRRRFLVSIWQPGNRQPYWTTHSFASLAFARFAVVIAFQFNGKLMAKIKGLDYHQQEFLIYPRSVNTTL